LTPATIQRPARTAICRRSAAFTRTSS
jgi:hypothetical protein